jgi:hypothetical protein
MIFAPALGPQAERMQARGHIVVDRLAMLPQRPDVMHLQHITPALMALVAFPDVPAVFTCHSATIELEAPRLHPQIKRYVAVDDLCRALCVERGIPEDRLSVILNAVDMERFKARSPVPPEPKTALMLTKTLEQQNLVRGLRESRPDTGSTRPRNGGNVGSAREYLAAFSQLHAWRLKPQRSAARWWSLMGEASSACLAPKT